MTSYLYRLLSTTSYGDPTTLGSYPADVEMTPIIGSYFKQGPRVIFNDSTVTHFKVEVHPRPTVEQDYEILQVLENPVSYARYQVRMPTGSIKWVDFLQPGKFSYSEFARKRIRILGKYYWYDQTTTRSSTYDGVLVTRQTTVRTVFDEEWGTEESVSNLVRNLQKWTESSSWMTTKWDTGGNITSQDSGGVTDVSAGYSREFSGQYEVPNVILPDNIPATFDLALARAKVPKDRDFNFGQVTQSAVEGIKSTDVLTSMYLAELPRIHEIVNALTKVLSSPKSIKTWADLALSWDYGTEATLRDTVSLLNDINKYRSYGGSFFVRGRKTRSYQNESLSFNQTLAEKIWLDKRESFILETWAFLDKKGLAPNLTLAWELIPFSFVVDWFFNVGGHLREVDNHTLYSCYRPRGCLLSRKTELACHPKLLGIHSEGEAYISEYTRWFSFLPYSPNVSSFKFSAASPGNYWSGALLFIQRFSK